MTDTTASVLTGQGDASTTASTTATTTATTTTATTTAATAATTTATATAIPWLEGADELTVGYVQNKAWQTPAEAVKSYQNLEKLLGADRAGNTVILPKPDASPEELGAFYNRLGRPADAAGYKIDVPDGGSKDFATAAAGKFHELGLSQKQGEALAAWWNETAGAQTTQSQQAKATQFAKEVVELDQEWGAAKAQNLAHAQNATRGLGLDAATIDKLSDALGHKATMNLLAKIGAKAGEDSFVTGDKVEGFSSAMTPAQAKAKIQSLAADKNHVARLLNKDAAATAEWEQLHKWAYPEE